MFTVLDYREWLIDVALASFALLTVASLAVAIERQPARRVRIIELALVGCVAIALLNLFPDRPRWRMEQSSSAMTDAVGAASTDTDAIDFTAPGSTASMQGIGPVTTKTTDLVPASVDPALVGARSAGSSDSAERSVSENLSAPSRFFHTWRWIGLAHGAISTCLLALWLLAIGAIRRVCKRSRPAPETVRELFREIAGPTGERVRLLVDAEGDRVFTFGWLRPAIVLTDDLCRPESTEPLRWSLAHEWSHVQRRDARAWHLMSLAGPLCFFQPAFWWLRRQLRLNQEHLADARGAAHAPTIEDYANFLLQMALGAERQPLASMMKLGPLRSDLSTRVMRLLRDRGRFEPRCPRWWGLGVLLAGTLAIGSTSTFTLSAAAPKEANSGATTDPSDAKDQVHLRVVDETGKPAAGIAVQAHVDNRKVIDLASDANGMVRLPEHAYSKARSIVFFADRGDNTIGWRDHSIGPKAPAATAADPLKMKLLRRTRRLTGRLMDERGEPARAVRLVCYGLREPTNGHAYLHAYRFRRSLLGETVTDESGAFSLPIPANASGSLIAHDARYASPPIRFRPSDERLDPVTLVDAGSIIGIVADAGGNGIEGVRLGAQILDSGQGYSTGGWGEAVTDAKGMYRIEALAPSVYNVLYMENADHPRRIARAIEGVRVRAGEDALADLEVIEGRRLHGTLVSLTNGAPVPDFPIGYHGSARPRSGASVLGSKTDERGRFDFFVPPGDAYLFMMKSGHMTPEATRTLVVPEAGDPTPVELKIRTAMIRGVVVDDKGSPVPNAPVGFESGFDFGATDDRGRFEIVLPQNETAFTILVDHPDYGRAVSQPIENGKVPKSVRIVLTPAEKSTVAGQAFGPDGKPLIGARATVYLQMGGGISTSSWPQATTDERGSYEFRHVRKGDSFYVSIEKKGFTRGSAKKIAKQTADRIEMEPVGIEGKQAPPAAVPAGNVIEKATRTLTGYLVDEQGRSLVGARVVFNSRKLVEGTSDREGMFELRGLPEGEIRVHISATGYDGLRQVVPAGENRIDLRLERSKEARR